MNKGLINTLITTTALLFGAQTLADPAATGATGQANVEPTHLTVHKSPTCGCCLGWMEHMHSAGFSTQGNHPEQLTQLKLSKGIQLPYQSCHTAVSVDGYVFEGHVPAKFINQFLANVPNKALGLSVPGMPVGSPGMEVGDKFMPYQVLLLKDDGTHEVYAQVNSAVDQL